MTPTEIREQLEQRGLVEAADRSGVYALRVDVPDTIDAVQEAWLRTHPEGLPEELLVPMAEAEDLLYVGGTGRPVRERLAEHAEGEVRQASLLQVFEPVAVVGVWNGGHSPMDERERARVLSFDGTRCWCDGEIF